jgi:hypothetical protein
MASELRNLEGLKKDLSFLIARHKRTRAWFWRTGISSLLAAVLWIIICNLASSPPEVKDTLAVTLGAVLMWTMFGWSFFLLRKLNRLTGEVKRLESRLTEFLISNSPSPDHDPR